MPISHISDTARWVATYRAMESARPDAIFHDPFAARLAGEEGPALVAHLPGARGIAWAMIVRTAVFDQMILDRVRNHGVTLVINLAAGLDARPWRLDLPPELAWVDVDLPDILAYKASVLAGETPHCRYQAVTTDLTDAAARRETLQRIAAGHERILVVSEGLLIYLPAGEVAALAGDIRAVPGVSWWLFDLASPRLLRMIQQRWGDSGPSPAARFQFAPAEGTAFFAPLGWREAVYRPAMEEAHRLRREMRGMWFWRLVARLAPAHRRHEWRRMSGYVLLERAGA